MDFDKFEGQMRLQRIHHPARAAITCRADNFQRLERRHVDIGQQMLEIGTLGVSSRQRAPRLRSGEVIGLGERPNLRKA